MMVPKETAIPEKLKREIEIYLKEKHDAEPLFRLYQEVFRLQQCYRGQIKHNRSWSREQSRELLLQGRYLLKDAALSVDPGLFRAILGEIIETFVRLFPQAEPLRKIMQQPELTENRLSQFLTKSSGDLEKHFRERGWQEDAFAGPALAAAAVTEALASFYISLAEEVREELDLALWSEGCCPVCGRQPAMAMLNREGARILECRFCYTRWQFPRMECPFCRNRDPQRLRYFYTDDYPGRRVQLCERCKSYLKTVVVKEIGREVILELENIFTSELDHLALREGYRAGGDLVVLR